MADYEVVRKKIDYFALGKERVYNRFLAFHNRDMIIIENKRFYINYKCQLMLKENDLELGVIKNNKIYFTHNITDTKLKEELEQHACIWFAFFALFEEEVDCESFFQFNNSCIYYKMIKVATIQKNKKFILCQDALLIFTLEQVRLLEEALFRMI